MIIQIVEYIKQENVELKSNQYIKIKRYEFSEDIRKPEDFKIEAYNFIGIKIIYQQ